MAHFFCSAYGLTLYTLITGGLLVRSAVTITYVMRSAKANAVLSLTTHTGTVINSLIS